MASSSHRDKYLQRGYEARSQSEKTLSEPLGIIFKTTEWSGRVFAEMEAQWKDTEFDWRKIHQEFRTHTDRLDCAVWVGDRLCCVFLACLTGESIVLRWVEADPRPDCPLRGRRLTIALDIVTNYAQRNGRHEVRVEPVDASKINLFEQDYGFKSVKPKNGSPYWAKQV